MVCRLIVFDKDGTLLDDQKTWGPVIARGAETYSHLFPGGAAGMYQMLGYDAVANTFSKDSLFMTASNPEICAKLAKEVSEEMGNAYGEWMSNLTPEEVSGHPVLPLRDMFLEIRGAGVKVAVLTNDNRRLCECFLRGEGVLDLVDTMVCGDDGLPAKPSGEPALSICQRLGVEPSEAAIVGDSSRDVHCGLNAGFSQVVGVSSGCSSTDDLLAAGAHVVFPTIADVPAYLGLRSG